MENVIPAFAGMTKSAFSNTPLKSVDRLFFFRYFPLVPETLDLNPEFLHALEVMEEPGAHCLITGRAGTGKSTLLEYFRSQTKIKVAVLAPTGVAAVNIRGQTIHSFFRFRTDITVETAAKTANRLRKQGKTEIYEQLDAILIDEISMVRADLLDCADTFLRTARRKKNVPFGGIKMIFIGDLYQLPPVVRSTERKIFADHYPGVYFFDAHVFPQMSLTRVELEKVYRQKDAEFVRLLNAVRNNSLTDNDAALFNRQFKPDFDPKNSLYVTLTAINDQARQINTEKLASLKTKTVRYHGEVTGQFEQGTLPTDETLLLKEGAQVMLLNNDPLGRWVNGTMAVITRLKTAKIVVRLETGGEEAIDPFTWNLFHYDYDSKKKTLVTENVGSFTQYPIRLAWAVTIHKSQGKTFDRVIIDVGRGTFATGQMYVALSRCRTLEGMILKTKLLRRHVLVDYRIMKFLTGHQYAVSDEKMPLAKKIAAIEEAIEVGGALEIVYLKACDEKSRRVIRPMEIGDMEYSGKTFLGLKAFCESRKEERHFRVDRILELSPYK